jgi:hypothetical protein
MAATYFLVLPTTDEVFSWHVVETKTNQIISQHKNLRLATPRFSPPYGRPGVCFQSDSFARSVLRVSGFRDAHSYTRSIRARWHDPQLSSSRDRRRISS